MAHKAQRDEIEAAKQASVGQLLFVCARLWNERAIQMVNQEAGKLSLRQAHTALLPYLSIDGGTRLTELARRAGVTKQAVGPLIEELEAEGVVERRPDPEDGRAKQIYFTARGREALLHGLSILRKIEAELEAELGAARMEALRDALPALAALLQRTAPTR